MFSKWSNKTTVLPKLAKTSILAVALAATVAACSPRISSHGNYPRPEQMERLIADQTDKRTILDVIGPPTTVGTFDTEVWYYMSQQFERFGFFEAELIEMNVVAFTFDENGIYQEARTYNLEDIRNISMSDDVTPTAGHEISFIQQMFGNFGKLN